MSIRKPSTFPTSPKSRELNLSNNLFLAMIRPSRFRDATNLDGSSAMLNVANADKYSQADHV
ncbi:hypothetical protein VB005_08534 [Metarhizium brunneum]